MKELTIYIKSTLTPTPMEEIDFPKINLGIIKEVSRNNVTTLAHKNYLEYLRFCYANHYSPVVSPDILWYGLLCEIAAMVKESPDRFRSVFTTSPNVTDIIVFSESLTELPLSSVMYKLNESVPSGIDKFFPKFTTSTKESIKACQAAFADAVSPYYRYSMFLCGFPSVIIQGTIEDWNLLLSSWKTLEKSGLFINEQDYFNRVKMTLMACRDALHNKEDSAQHWKNMFSLKQCGSGHDEDAHGWITELFKTKPSMPYVTNFPSHVSKVKYKQLNTGIEYIAFHGLFSFDVDGNILRPKFGEIVAQDLPPENKQPTKTNSIEFVMYETKGRKLKGIWLPEYKNKSDL